MKALEGHAPTTLEGSRGGLDHLTRIHDRDAFADKGDGNDNERLQWLHITGVQVYALMMARFKDTGVCSFKIAILIPSEVYTASFIGLRKRINRLAACIGTVLRLAILILFRYDYGSSLERYYSWIVGFGSMQ